MIFLKKGTDVEDGHTLHLVTRQAPAPVATSLSNGNNANEEEQGFHCLVDSCSLILVQCGKIAKVLNKCYQSLFSSLGSFLDLGKSLIVSVCAACMKINLQRKLAIGQPRFLMVLLWEPLMYKIMEMVD